MTACTQNRLSWLALEQYHLGELAQEKRLAVSKHLAGCADCAWRLESIENDTYQLPPLPAIEPKSTFGWGIPTLAWRGGALALAAAAVAIILVVVFRQEPQAPSQTISFKGGELAVTLVRERGGQVLENPSGFEDGDRVMTRLTCPGTEPVEWDVVVFQNGEANFPYPSRQMIRCGNNVPLPGAFFVTGIQAITVCVIVDEIPEREDIEDQGIDALPESSVCTTLEPL